MVIACVYVILMSIYFYITGLVGGSVPVFDEVILSTSRMNKINSIDPTAGTECVSCYLRFYK